MNQQVLFAKLLELSPSEKRGQTDEFLEAVFLNTSLSKLNKVLEEFLGEALKPADAPANSQARDAAKPYGGIYVNQTLYRKELQDRTAIAMLWPWGNNTHTTLKIILEKNK